MSEMQDSVWPQEELPEPPEFGAPESEATEPSVEAEAPSEPETPAGTAPEPVAPVATTEEPEAMVTTTPEPEPAGPRATMTEVLADDFAYLQAKRGEIRQAQIISISDDGIMVDLGLKREGLIPGYDLQRVGAETARELSEQMKRKSAGEMRFAELVTWAAALQGLAAARASDAGLQDLDRALKVAWGLPNDDERRRSVRRLTGVIPLFGRVNNGLALVQDVVRRAAAAGIGPYFRSEVLSV